MSTIVLRFQRQITKSLFIIHFSCYCFVSYPCILWSHESGIRTRWIQMKTKIPIKDNRDDICKFRFLLSQILIDSRIFKCLLFSQFWWSLNRFTRLFVSTCKFYGPYDYSKNIRNQIFISPEIVINMDIQIKAYVSFKLYRINV